jgi:hypothetical protein
MSTLDARPVILGFALVVLTVSSAVAEAASPRERYTVGDPPVSDGFSANYNPSCFDGFGYRKVWNGKCSSGCCLHRETRLTNEYRAKDAGFSIALGVLNDRQETSPVASCVRLFGRGYPSPTSGTKTRPGRP